MKNKKIKNVKDNSFKQIFSNNQLFCEFITSFIDVDLLKNIKPEDVEDMNNRFITTYKENRDSDTVKKIKLDDNSDMFVITLIEHQSTVNYLMSFRMLEYMVLIWKDYIKEHENECKAKEFMLPPILPIVFYEGVNKWTSKIHFADKVRFSNELCKYIPNFEYGLVDLNEYTEKELINLENLLSIILIIVRIKETKDFKIVKNIPKEMINEVTKNTSKELLFMIAGIVEQLLKKINLPDEEIEIVTEQIYERKVNNMFEFFEDYDIQATRKEAREEGIKQGRNEGEEIGKIEGEKKGKIKGEIIGIELAKKVFKLSREGISMNDIAKKCNVSLDKVKMILED